MFCCLLFIACKKENKTDDNPPPSSGDADFTTYVAVGNSLAAGFADGALYRSGQENAYPALLASVFQQTGGGIFRQPLLPGNAGWPDIKQVSVSRTDCAGHTISTTADYTGTIDTAGSATSIAAQGPYHNMGVPGIRCVDYRLPAYGVLNHFARRFFSSPATTTPLQEATMINPSFFTLWIGSNDVLGYALDGGTGLTSGMRRIDISPVEVFRQEYKAIVDSLTAQGARGVLINISDLTSSPFFTTIPPDGLILSTAGADNLNATYAGSGMHFAAGANYFVIEDELVSGGRRQAKAGEYILMSVPHDSLVCGQWGSYKPLSSSYVLDAVEIAAIQDAIATFNQIILEEAQAHNLAHVDMYRFMQTLSASEIRDIFSLDNIHLTPRGSAVAANEILRGINQFFNATLPLLDEQAY